MDDNTKFACGKCAATWRAKGSTNCWSSDPKTGPPQPDRCPAKHHGDLMNETFELYKGDSEDAKMAFVAGRVEGLCYEPIPGSNAPQYRLV